MSTAKKLIGNSLFLYFRMLFLMLISLYTSRILLAELGIDDFGLYGVVGGVVALFASLRSLFSSATQRFLNIEIGRQNDKALNEIFNLSFLINIVIAIIFISILETIGLWFVQNELVIPSNRLTAANWVFQFSILSSIITIFTIPFDALIIAHQRMNYYAYISIIEGVLKLVVIYLLRLNICDKLILYGILISGISMFIFCLNLFYCRIKFPEAKFCFFWDKKRFKELFSFAGWNFAGITAFSLTNEGLNFCLNIFGGVTLNASRTITYQVKSALTNFVANINVAISPQTIQFFGQKEYDQFYRLLFFSNKVCSFVYILIAAQIFFFLDDILSFWLETIPEYTQIFIKINICYMLLRVIHMSIDLLYKSFGNLKSYQMIEILLLSIPLPISYLSLKYGYPPYIVFIYVTIFELINCIIICLNAKRITNIDLKKFFYISILPIVKVLFVCITIDYLVMSTPSIYWSKFISIFLINTSCIFFIGFTKKERINIITIFKEFINK